MHRSAAYLHRKTERGNALWFIMIAIILMAALTLVLSRSGSSVGQSGDAEQHRIRSTQILRHAKGLEAAIEQMRLNGISENSISFENNETTTDYTNPNCPSGACQLFSTSGAGLRYMPPPRGTNDGSEWIFTGANNIGSVDFPVGTSGAQTGNDIIMLLPNADIGLCTQINRELRVGTGGTLPEDANSPTLTPFTGTFENALVLIDGDAPDYPLGGKNAGCFVDTGDEDTVYFYYVLLAR